MTDRTAKLRDGLEERLLVTNGVNVRYLTGFQSSNAALLVEPDRVRLFSDFRYAEAGRAVEGVEFVEASRNLLAHLAELLSGRIAFEADALTYAGYEALREGGLDPVPRKGLVEALRAVKDEAEITAIRRAAEVADGALERFADGPFVGQSERALAWRLEQLLHEQGADGVAFPIIVAAGPSAARPHTVPGERVVEPGQTVLVDFGCKVDGYNSDCTRTFAAGSLPQRLEDAYAVCLDAQLAGLAAVRPAARSRDVDAVARTQIDDGPFAGTFGHGLGHGLGLEVHEAPTLSRIAPEDQVLAAGNVVTVEPGIYLEGSGGVRIEDLVIVRDDGPEVLSSFTKELITVS